MKIVLGSVVRAFISLNKKASFALNALLPARLSLDGNRYFLETLVPQHFQDDVRVYDVGGGSQPYFSVAQKNAMNLQVVGLDIDPDELSAAPDGAYDETLARDLCTFTGQGDADLVICQATLEHVRDTAGAIRSIASMLKPGGKALIFAPSRNALFARLNLVLPQKWKERILYFVYPVPDVIEHQGFPAYYDKCTPRDIARLAQANGLEVSEQHLFWMSSYFFNFLPAFLFWRLYQGVFRLFSKGNAAETFAFVLTRKR